MYERNFEVYMAAFQYFIKSCEAWIGDADIQITIENTDKCRQVMSGRAASFGV